ncbi:MAG: hypothetical protein KAU62_15720 [Candidatus Heimdallarchaeota archaeon]|nr:hypothetical protein [Candidatus Heimdallarchaeota archaeon]MCG3257552.1 hypothetical protein [Candidatus Heimdallarchaeota archaeon]MCK4612604.1 hypothetical protein [Candidatus Heimdallarchaeota archaeon]
MLNPAELESLDYLEEGMAFAQERIRKLEKDNLFLFDLLNQSLIILFDQLNDKQKGIFFESYSLIERRKISLNRLAEKISTKLDISFSTAKWNITKLRDFGFFETIGMRGNTKTTLISTIIGDTLYSTLGQIKNKNR